MKLFIQNFAFVLPITVPELFVIQVEFWIPVTFFENVVRKLGFVALNRWLFSFLKNFLSKVNPFSGFKS